MSYDTESIRESMRQDIKRMNYTLLHSNARPTGQGSPKQSNIRPTSVSSTGEKIWRF
jgi:hypothetical protein